MPSCACPPSSLTRVTFAHGVAMRRCPRHEVTAWTVDGVAAAGDDVRPVLKDLFVEQRGVRGTRVARKPRPRAAAPVQASSADLTALLNARGLPGSWTVA